MGQDLQPNNDYGRSARRSLRLALATMGTAMQQGAAWGMRAADWSAVQEWKARPAYEAVLDACAPWRETRLLDVGCGSGAFASLADAAGARVAGLDASAELVEIAESRVPDGAFRVGDMADLPYADGSFDLVVSIDSLPYAAVPLAALFEAVRVTRPGGRVVVLVWSSSEECDAAAYLRTVHSLRPVAAFAPEPFALSPPGVMEDLLALAGLSVSERQTVPCTWFYADEDTALRGLLSSGPAVSAVGSFDEDAVREAVLESILPYRCDGGAYLLRNTFRYLVGTR